MIFKLDIAYLNNSNAKKLKKSGQDFFHREDVVIKEERINVYNLVRYHEYPDMDGKTLMYFSDGGQAIVDYSPEEIDEKIKNCQLFNLIPN